jgi:hypothetical protein
VKDLKLTLDAAERFFVSRYGGLSNVTKRKVTFGPAGSLTLKVGSAGQHQTIGPFDRKRPMALEVIGS